MSEVQHALALKLLPILAEAIWSHKPITYVQAAEALGRDGKKNARMIAQVCDLLDAAAAAAKIPLLALVAVKESSGHYNHKAFAEKGAPVWLREAIIEHSLQHRFTKGDVAAIARSISNLAELGNRAAWRRFSQSMSKEQRYRQLTGLDELSVSKMLVEKAGDEAERRYWAFVADPQRYRIADAVMNIPTDTWTTKGRPIKAGDCAIIWQARDKAGRRGIVALAEITGSPKPCTDKGNPYWINPAEADATTERVSLRYIRIAYPLWTDGQQATLLKDLSVARARGGTIFHVTATQWKELSSFSDDADFDIELVRRRSGIKQTQCEALIQARLGQGRFRQDLLKHWGGCAVTGCSLHSILRASHIRPWRISSDHQRLDPENGILLVANLDALFNDGLITFADSGAMIVSDHLPAKERNLLRVEGSLLKQPSANQQDYLKYHRENEFLKD